MSNTMRPRVKIMFFMVYDRGKAKRGLFRKASERWRPSCFAVYVGPEKERFVIKAKQANHPLFMILLEEAEYEYGYNCEGPLFLPCEISTLCNVLAEIEAGDHETRQGCCFLKGSGAYRLLAPSRVMPRETG